MMCQIIWGVVSITRTGSVPRNVCLEEDGGNDVITTLTLPTGVRVAAVAVLGGVIGILPNSC